MKSANKHHSNIYAFDQCRSLQSKPFDNNSKKKKVLFVGDSQACDFLNGLSENGYLNNYQVRFRFVPYPCQRIPGDHVSKYVKRRDQSFCLHSSRADSFMDSRDQIQNADIIVLSALWKLEVAKKLNHLVNSIKVRRNQRLLVIGNKFFGKMSVRKYIHMPARKLRNLENDIGDETVAINDMLRRSTRGRAIFIDPHKIICGNDTRCPIFTNDLKLISYDGRHLTQAGAKFIGKALYHRGNLSKIF